MACVIVDRDRLFVEKFQERVAKLHSRCEMSYTPLAFFPKNDYVIGMRAVLAKTCLALSLLIVAPGCALLGEADSALDQGADALRFSAGALTLLNSVAGDYLDSLHAPTPDQLQTAAMIVVEVQNAKRDMSKAREALKDLKIGEANSSLKDSLYHMETACELLQAEGVDVDSVLKAVHDAKRYLP